MDLPAGGTEMEEEYGEVDVSGWDPAGDEQIGSKPKQWLFEPNYEQHWLWKPRTFNPAKGGDVYPKGDDWAEKIACEFARALGTPCADVELARRGDELGIISRSFTDRTEEPRPEFTPGNVLLGGAIDGYHPSLQRGGEGYTVKSVNLVLAGVAPPVHDAALSTAFDWFVAYLVLDAWIGNTDRHHQNWGVLHTSGADVATLAPSFDHASSLGFLLSDAERNDRLATDDPGYSVQAFTERAETPFEGKPHPVAVAAAASAMVSDEVVEVIRARLSSQEGVGPEVLGRVPPDRMSHPAREFAADLLAANASVLLSHLTRRLDS